MTQGSSEIPVGGTASAMLCLAMLLTACNHTEPFTHQPGTDVPFDPGPPARLTLNTAHDGHGTWLGDGSGILYSAQQLDRVDTDVCLAQLPPTGGSQRRLVCDIPGDTNSTDAAQIPAVAPDGRLALLSAGNATIGGTSPSLLTLALAFTLDASNLQTVRSLPLVPEGGVEQDYAGYLRWLNETRLVYVGQRFRAVRLCADGNCAPDTLLYGTEVTLLDLAGRAVAIDGTAEATGVAPVDGGQAILYTLTNDTRLYRRSLADGTTTVIHDFGPAGIVRDVHAAADRIAVIVGGRIAFADHPIAGPTQFDSGGVVHLLDLNGENEVVLDVPERLFRRPSVSPDGSAVVAEGYPLIFTGTGTVVGKSGDLYLFGGQ
jgi:hypothetical protein